MSRPLPGRPRNAGIGETGEERLGGVACIVARLIPTAMHGERGPEDLLDGIACAFGVPPEDLLAWYCLGRQDLLVLVKTDALERAGEIPRERGVRKMHIQYGYMTTEGRQALFGSADAWRQYPAVFAMYARLNDASLAAFANDDAAQLEQARALAQAAARRTATAVHTIRTLGAMDLLVLGQSNRMDRLTRCAREVWSASVPWPEGGTRPLFSRTYTMEGFRLLRSPEPRRRTAALCALDAQERLRLPRIEMRLRGGVGDSVLQEAQAAFSALGITPRVSMELGHEDATLVFAPRARTPRVRARDFLQAYYDEFLPRARNHVFSTQLCLGAGGPLRTLTVPDVEGTVLRFGWLAPEEVHRHLTPLRANEATASVADAVQALYEAVDWAVEGEATRTSMGDLWWHLHWLLTEYWPSLRRGNQTMAGLAEQMAHEVKHLNDAFSQRLLGAYYGVMGYSPEQLFSQPMGLDKIVLALWALHSGVLRHLFGAAERPSGCWLVGYGEGPRVGSAGSAGLERTFILPSRALAAPERHLIKLGHEIAHVLHNVLARRRESGWGSDRLEAVEAAARLALGDFALAIARSDENDAGRLAIWTQRTRELPREVFADTIAIDAFTDADVPLYVQTVAREMADTGSVTTQWAIRLFCQWYLRTQKPDARNYETARLGEAIVNADLATACCSDEDVWRIFTDVGRRRGTPDLLITPLRQTLADLHAACEQEPSLREVLRALGDSAAHHHYVATSYRKRVQEVPGLALCRELARELPGSRTAGSGPFTARIRFIEKLWADARRDLTGELSPWVADGALGVSPWRQVATAE